MIVKIALKYLMNKYTKVKVTCIDKVLEKMFDFVLRPSFGQLASHSKTNFALESLKNLSNKKISLRAKLLVQGKWRQKSVTK